MNIAKDTASSSEFNTKVSDQLNEQLFRNVCVNGSRSTILSIGFSGQANTITRGNKARAEDEYHSKGQNNSKLKKFKNWRVGHELH